MSEPLLPPHRSQLHEALDRTALLLRLDAFPGLGADRDAELVDVLRTVGVRVVADRANLACPNGQTALVTLVCQCAMVGLRIDLDVPDARQLVPQPPLDANLPLGSALVAWTDALFPGCLSRVAAPPLTFAIGDTPTIRAAEPVVHVTGAEDVAALAGDRSGATRWHGVAHGVRSALARRQRPRRCAPRSNARCPARPAAAARHYLEAAAVHSATPAAARPQRPPGRARQPRQAPARSRTRPYTRCCGSQTSPPTSGPSISTSSRAATPTATRSHALPTSDSPRLTSSPVRDGTPSGSAAYLAASTRTRSPLSATWRRRYSSASMTSRPGGSSSGSPAWVGVGATSHAFVVVSDHLPGHPCAGCVHPLDDDNQLEEIPTIGFVSLWAGLLLAGTLLAPDAATRPGARRIEAHPMGLYGPDGVKLLPQVHNVRCPVCGPQASAA